MRVHGSADQAGACRPTADARLHWNQFMPRSLQERIKALAARRASALWSRPKWIAFFAEDASSAVTDLLTCEAAL